jgi:RNA polymerase sigma factor (sigma-70 family)
MLPAVLRNLRSSLRTVGPRDKCKTPADEGVKQVTADPTVFLVDDDPNIHTSLRALVESVGLRIECFKTAQEFLNAHDPARAGCLVIEVRLPGINGLDLLEQLVAQGTAIPAIVVTRYGDVATAVRAMKGGAVDFVEKPLNDQAMLDSIHRAIARDVHNRRMQAEHHAIGTRSNLLTPRERQVMDLVVAGKANKEIAAQLGCSRKTVEVHRARVMEKMQADSLATLVRMALALRNGVPENRAANVTPTAPRAATV